MKILTDKYPIGTIPNQRTAGRYVDGNLYENIKILAKKVTNDQTWLGVISSSTLEVGTGKSTFVQQIGEMYLDCLKQLHNIDIPITMQNIVWRPKDLIERAFKVPRYSVMILDEWEDTRYWSQLGITLRQFFRKCRQLNLFILVIIPNFFQLPIHYAVSRSVFFIDVHFEGEFERGFFKFYNFERKKDLYIKGKKNHDYKVVFPNFYGRFLDGYVVNEQEYRQAKLNDMKKEEEDKVKEGNPPEIEIRRKYFIKIHKYFLNKQEMGKVKGYSMSKLAEAFRIDHTTASDWLKNEQLNQNNEITATPLIEGGNAEENNIT